MKKLSRIVFSAILSIGILGSALSPADAHPGRLDSNGGHNCSDASIKKGLCTGYHWHDANGKPVYTKPGTAAPKPAPAPVKTTPTPVQPAPIPKPIKVVLDGEEQKYNQSPVIENGNTLVPMRAIFESLGAEVGWDNNTRTVTGKKQGKTVELVIGSKSAKIDGKSSQLAVAPKIINGNTMVPVRFISESLGATVGWDGTTRTVTITSAKEVVKEVATVTRVVDGDTVNIMLNGKEESVRLLLVDTPETVHPSLPIQPFGQEASDFAKEVLTVGKEVYLEYDGPKKDKYDRVLGYIWVDGKNFNLMLLEKGLARVAYVYDPPYTHYNAFIAAETKARSASIGIWSIPGYVTDEGFKGEKAS